MRSPVSGALGDWGKAPAENVHKRKWTEWKKGMGYLALQEPDHKKSNKITNEMEKMPQLFLPPATISYERPAMARAKIMGRVRLR